MKEKKTMMENRIEEWEELRKAELRYWQKMHPNAKVVLKKNEIVITYPLPKDMELISKFIKAL
jgi:hypothetical protein